MDTLMNDDIVEALNKATCLEDLKAIAEKFES